jgi:hypothetical protein
MRGSRAERPRSLAWWCARRARCRVAGLARLLLPSGGGVSRVGACSRVPGGSVCECSSDGDRGLGVVRLIRRDAGCRGEWNTPPLPAGALGRGVGRCGQASKGVWGMSWRREAQGRDRRRNARGSRQVGSDPGVPEPTGGTETSQYPQEGKETSTPSVAASERGLAQTTGVTPWGCRTTSRTWTGSGTALNRRRDRVKAPYAKLEQAGWDPEYDPTRGSGSESAGTIPQG